MTSPEIRVFDEADLPRAAAERLAADIRAVVAERGRCRFGLSGGNTPRSVYEHMSKLPIEWRRISFFWGDERCVPKEDEKSNFKLASDALFCRVDVPDANVFRIEGEREPAEAARRFARVLGDAPIDILMLGMGADGHTASLFPGEADLGSQDRVIAAKSPVAPCDRVTLTIKAINEARAVYFLIAGADKADRLAQIQEQIAGGRPELPMAHVQPSSGKLVWLVDRKAAAGLKRPTTTDRVERTWE